jgi:phosphatidylserine decarboxylase
MTTVVRIRDRVTGGVEIERIFGGDSLDFLYGTRVGRALTSGFLARRLASEVYGWRQRSPKSRARIALFVARLGIDPSEASLPLAAYRSLDEFFTRRLRPGARPIDADPAHLVSPADGRALAFERLDAGSLGVKGSRVTLAELVGDVNLAASLGEASALVVRLAPADYHRFHFPDDGAASPARRLPGPLHSVHPIALAAGAPSFRNQRDVTRFESAHFGPMLLVSVGALLVGTIVQTYAPGSVRRGDEKGYFRFGGSTVVLVARADRVAFDPDLLTATAEGLESRVSMGTRVGVRR